MTQCRHDITKGWMGVLDSHSADFSPRTQCRLPAGHDGKHHAWFQPFPGFADEHRYWDDDSSRPTNEPNRQELTR